jgi:hypothetical protein
MPTQEPVPPRDPDRHKGAIEGDRPDDEQTPNPHGDGLNDEGLPNDPVASAEDAIGANVDQTQG